LKIEVPKDIPSIPRTVQLDCVCLLRSLGEAEHRAIRRWEDPRRIQKPSNLTTRCRRSPCLRYYLQPHCNRVNCQMMLPTIAVVATSTDETVANIQSRRLLYVDSHGRWQTARLCSREEEALSSGEVRPFSACSHLALVPQGGDDTHLVSRLGGSDVAVVGEASVRSQMA